MQWSTSLIRQQPVTGRMIKEDGSAINIADLLSDTDSDADIAAEEAANIFSASNGSALRTVLIAGLPVLSIRAKTAGTLIVPLEISMFSSGNSYFEILINPTLTGASWASAGSSAGAEIDIAATSLTGGTRVGSGYINLAGGAMQMIGRDTLLGHLGLEYDIATNIGDIITIHVKPFAGSVSASGSVQWRKVV